jgi:hypothetical protein
MRSEILTDKIIRELKPDPAREYHVWDLQLPGFGVRVRPSGHKTYVHFYRAANRSRMRKLTLGPVEAIQALEARRQARERLGKIAAGEDPADKKLAYRAGENSSRNRRGA